MTNWEKVFATRFIQMNTEFEEDGKIEMFSDLSLISSEIRRKMQKA